MNVSVNGPRVLFEIPILGGIKITETIRNQWIVIFVLVLLSIILTRNLKVKNPSKKQLAIEKIYLMLQNLVKNVMGERNMKFMPYIGTLFSFSMLSSLSGLTGLRAPTADLSTTLAMALVTFFMVQIVNIAHNGVKGWLKGFTQPVAFILPLNLVSEIANPISMAFRHFGNIASGIVITTLVYGALGALSSSVFGYIPVLRDIPLLQAGLPALLSIYFDVFTSFLQAYIISMLTMVFVSSANE